MPTKSRMSYAAQGGPSNDCAALLRAAEPFLLSQCGSERRRLGASYWSWYPCLVCFSRKPLVTPACYMGCTFDTDQADRGLWVCKSLARCDMGSQLSQTAWQKMQVTTGPHPHPTSQLTAPSPVFRRSGLKFQHQLGWIEHYLLVLSRESARGGWE